jgi:hypothetical protein
MHKIFLAASLVTIYNLGMSAVVKRDIQGRLMPGNAPTNAAKFQPGEWTGTDGRPWLSDEERQLLRQISPKVINTALDILAMPLTPGTAYAKLSAIDTILSYAYGTPQIATLVRYEVDLIIEAYGLPPRNQLRGKDGHYLFGPQGGFKPSMRYTSAWDRQQAVERIKAQQAEDVPIEDHDADQPPEVHVYPHSDTERGPRRGPNPEPEQKPLTESQPPQVVKVDGKWSVDPKPTEPEPIQSEQYRRWKALSE